MAIFYVDQMIAATARVHGATIVTQDRLISEYSHVKTVCGLTQQLDCGVSKPRRCLTLFIFNRKLAKHSMEQSREQPDLQSLRNPWRLFPLLVFAIAACLRVLYLLELSQLPLSGFAIGPDVSEYDSWARRILGGELLWGELHIHAPLYPYTLALFYWLGGVSLMFARVLQTGLELLALLAVYGGLRNFARRRTADLCLCLWAVYQPLMYFGAEPVSEILVILFLSLAFFFWSIAITAAEEKDGSRRRNIAFAGCGLAFGLSAIAHPLSLPAALCCVAATFWLCLHRHGVKQACRIGVIVLAGLLLPILPVTVRNFLVSGEVVLVQARSGMNFYLGNNPDADGTCYLRPGPEYDALANWPRREGIKREREAARFYHERSFEFIREQPAAWAGLLLRKLLLTWNRAELASGPDLPELRYATRMMRRPLVGFAVLVPLAFCGFFACRKRREFVFPAAVIAAYTITLTLFVTSARYRLGMLPFLIIFAAAGADWLLSIITDFIKHRQRLADTSWAKRRQAVPAALLLLAGSLLVNLPVLPERLENEALTRNESALIQAEALWRSRELAAAAGVLEQLLNSEPDNAQAMHLLGAVAADMGNYDEAVRHYRQALEIIPADQVLRTDLALALAQTGKLDQAVAEFETILDTNPQGAKAAYNLAVILEQQGLAKSASDRYLQALEADPGFASAHLNYAMLHHRWGDMNLAARHYRIARRLAPKNEKVWNGLAILAVARKNPRRAQRYFRRSLRLNPDQPAVRTAFADFLKETGAEEEAARVLKQTE